MTLKANRLAARRAAYASEILARGRIDDPQVEAAFAKIPREKFLGPPPWTILPGALRPARDTSDPAELYQDVLVALDADKGINNGQPSLHALCISALRLTSGDHVLHIGAGTGYYTAILAELAGTVDAYEIEPALATLARQHLRTWPGVTVHEAIATGRALPAADAIYVNAGATHPDTFWLDALRDGGRLLFPLTGDEGWGGMLRIERTGAAFAARFISQCGFIDCVGARDPETGVRLTRTFRVRELAEVRSLVRDRPRDEAIWFAGDGWYLSTDPPA